MRITLDTLCDSKLHHHGNHYQENWVIRECLGVVGDRGATQSSGREEFMPGGQEGRVDITLQLNRFDPGALLFAQSHGSRGGGQEKEKELIFYHILNLH